MANWLGVITNAGNSLLNEWVNEKTLNFDSAAAGEGTVSPIALLTQTDLVGKQQTVNILGAEKVSSGIRLKLRISAPETGYRLTQYGVWASVDGGESVLLALFQHEAGGVPIPSVADSPDFVFTFYALISTSNTGSWTVNIDTSTVATMAELNKTIKDYYAGVGSAIIRDILIPRADWVKVGADSEGFGEYAYTVDVAVEESTEDHFPDVALDILSLRIAREADMCQTSRALDGIVRFWANAIPLADMTGTIQLRSENMMEYAGGGSGSGGSVDGADIATDEEVNDVIDDIFDGGSSDEGGDSGSDSDPDSSQDDIATDEEVNDAIDDVFGGGSSGESGDTETDDSETDDGNTDGSQDIATDEEVNDVIDGIFG